jgi:peptide/nickel transport system substrate-binding protein
MTLACFAGAGMAGSERSLAKPVLTIGLPFAPGSLDPTRGGLGPELSMRSLSHAALTHLRPDGSIVPGLATSFHYLGRGNKNFEFTLRRDARFSDGSPVTAGAVKTWLTYWASRSPLAGNLGPIRSIEAVGKWRVRLHLASPNPIIPILLSEAYNLGAVSSAKAIDAKGPLGTQTFGAGPYVLVRSQTVTGDHYTYVPNRFFHDKSALRFSKVIVKIISSPSSMLGAMKAGQIDVAFGDASTADAAAASGLKVIQASAGTDGLFLLDQMGTLTPALRDIRVRQALNYAVDRNAITRALMGKYGTPTSELVTTDGFDPKFQNFYPYNPAKAKSLLAAAGYADGFTFDVVDQGFLGNLGDPLVQAIAKYLAPLNVRLNITAAATGGEWFTKGFLGKVPVAQGNLDNNPMWFTYGLCFKPKAVLNPFGIENSAINKLALQGQRSDRPQSYWVKMSQEVTKSAWLLPVFMSSNIWYASKDVGGVALSSRSVVPFAAEWFPK